MAKAKPLQLRRCIVMIAPTAPTPAKRPRGAPRKYLTKEEWQEAKRINARNTYQRHPEEMKAARQAYKKEHTDELKLKAKERYERKKDADKVNRLMKRIAHLVGGSDGNGKLDENARAKLARELQAQLTAMLQAPLHLTEPMTTPFSSEEPMVVDG